MRRSDVDLRESHASCAKRRRAVAFHVSVCYEMIRICNNLCVLSTFDALWPVFNNLMQ